MIAAAVQIMKEKITILIDGKNTHILKNTAGNKRRLIFKESITQYFKIKCSGFLP